jgi:hypothetical protein
MGLTFNITYDSSVSNAPAGFKAAVGAAAQAYENLFANPITINIQVGYGEIMGQSLGGALGESMSYQNAYSYSPVRNALITNATSATDQSAIKSLSAADPTNGATILTTSAEAKALGLSGASTAIDGYVGFSNTYPFSYNPNQRAIAGAYDFIGVVEHEFSEVMGRISELSTTIGSALSVLDLFRYSSPGARQFVGGQPAYFSTDGGATNLNNFNTDPNGDYGDWAASAGNDAFLAMSGSGVANGLTQADIAELDALGYTTTAAAGTPPPPPVTPAPAPGTTATSMTVAAAIAAYTANPQMAAVAVSDSAANVNAGLDALQQLAAAAKLASIVLTGAASGLTVSAAQLSNDAGAIGAITSNYTLQVTNVSVAVAASVSATAKVTAIIVSDSAAHVAGGLDSLQALAAGGKIASITLTDSGTPTLSLTAGQLRADAAIIGRIASVYNLAVSGVTAATAMSVAMQPHVASIAVSDSAANVAANLDGLQLLATMHKLSTVSLTGTGTPSLSISAAQFTADQVALRAISTPYALNVSGVNVAAIPSILMDPRVTSASVSDSVVNVNAGLDALQQLVGQHRLSSISLTQAAQQVPYYYYYYYSYGVPAATVPTLAVTAAQLSRDAGAIAAITSTFNINVSGVGAASAAAVAALPHVTSITISDSAANVSSNIDALQPLVASGKISSISLSDAGVPQLVLTANQLKTDAAVFATIVSSYALAVGGVTAGTAMSIANQPHVASVAITDSAANVAANLDALQGLATAHKLATISLTGMGLQTLSITAAQFAADAAALHAISTAYALNVTGVTVAGMSPILANAQVASVAVSDTATNVSAGLDALQQVAGQHRLASINLTLSAAQAAQNYYYNYYYGAAAPAPIVPTLAVMAAQLSPDSGALAAIASAYTMSVSGVNAAAAATIAALLHVTSITVSDSAANISSHLDGLQALAVSGKIASVTLTDAGTPTLAITASEFKSDSAALSDVAPGYSLAVSSATVSVANSLSARPNLVSIALVDSAANVNASLDQLQGLAARGKLASIALTDSGTPTLRLTAAQQSADVTALHDISTPFSVQIVSALPPVTAVPSVANFVNAVSSFAPPPAASTFYSQPNNQGNGMWAFVGRPQA